MDVGEPADDLLRTRVPDADSAALALIKTAHRESGSPRTTPPGHSIRAPRAKLRSDPRTARFTVAVAYRSDAPISSTSNSMTVSWSPSFVSVDQVGAELDKPGSGCDSCHTTDVQQRTGGPNAAASKIKT